MDIKEKIEKVIDMVLETAEFNEYFINGHESFKESYHEDLGRKSFKFYVEFDSVKGKSKHIIVEKDSEGQTAYYMFVDDYEKEKHEELTVSQILSDEKLADEFLQNLINKLDAYHFKYEDIKSGKALSLQPDGSDIALHIEEYLLKLADMLDKGLHSKAYTKLNLGEAREHPMIIELSQFGGKANFEFTFKNHLLPGREQVEKVSIDQALKAISPDDIENHQLTLPLSDRAQYILRGLLKLGLPEILCEYTSGLNSNALFHDVVKVIQFRANKLDISLASIARINEELGDSGIVMKDAPVQLRK